MKKSLLIISFAFIFLLTLSVVSAGFFDWLTGDVQRSVGVDQVPTAIGDNPLACKSDADCVNRQVCFNGHCVFSPDTGISTAGTSSARRTSASPGSARFGAAGDCPRGWNIVSAKEGGNCCIKAENKGRTTGGLFRRG